MDADPALLLETLDITTTPVGLYDAPDPEMFAPLVSPRRGTEPCLFAYYRRWQRGQTLHLTADAPGCEGCGWYLFDLPVPGDEHLAFLVEEEGICASRALAAEWMADHRAYRPQHDNVLVGPLRAGHEQYLRTITFFVTPDQLGGLVTGVHYEASVADPSPVIAPFGAGCMQLLTLFEDLDVPQAIIGGLDLSARPPLPADVLAFTVTRPMFERLCRLDEASFLFKPYWRDLRALRARQRGSAT